MFDNTVTNNSKTILLLLMLLVYLKIKPQIWRRQVFTENKCLRKISVSVIVFKYVRDSVSNHNEIITAS